MSNQKWTDKVIIEAIAGNSKLLRDKALFFIFKESGWKEMVIKWVMQKGGNKQDCEDVIQETLIGFDRNLRKEAFKGNSSLKTYFFSIAKFQWISMFRKRKPTDELNSKITEEIEESIEIKYIKKEQKQFLTKALEQLSKKCQKLLELNGLSYSTQEIALEMGFSSASMAKKETYRCRIRFRNFINSNPKWVNLIR